MWSGVTSRFRRFQENVSLTPDQKSDGVAKHHRVRRCLNRHYYQSNSDNNNSFLVGSWGKHTRVRPPRDIDLLFELPFEVYQRFEKHVGNKQSALLQEIKNVLRSTFPATDMSGDGQVVQVRFNTLNVEVVPAILLQSGQYWICDTHDGGRYKTTDPRSELNYINAIHLDTNQNLKKLVKMIKIWQNHCNVPIKSFWIELVACNFLSSWEFKNQGYFFYDWMVRDFFLYLKDQANSYVFVPGTYEMVLLGDAWKSKAETAAGRAIKACEDEKCDYVSLAGEKWQRIFGTQIPKT